MNDENLTLISESERIKPQETSFSLSALSFKLGYDGKRAANNLTGLGNYSRSLIESLSINYPKNQYFIYTPKMKDFIAKLPLFALKNIFLKLPENGISKFLWRSLGIKIQLLNDHIDLFHGLSHEIPFGIEKTQIKSIVTIHDLIFLRHPKYYKIVDRLIYKFKSKYACKNADRIIAISEKTKEDIVDLYGINPEKIDVIYQSCDDQFKRFLSAEEKQIVKVKYSLPDKYILNLGTIEARKNLLLLIKALPKIDADFKLIVVGKETSYAEIVKAEIDKLGLKNRVVFLKDIPFSDLPAIYQLASAFVFPSFYEGFGIPIIEALYGGIPVIAATGSCLEEAGGPWSIYISPRDNEKLAMAVNEVLKDSSLRKLMIENGLEHVQKFNTEIVTAQLMGCYEKTINHKY